MRTPGLPDRRSNLPAPLTTFVGREDDIGAVSQLLADVRLITLTGTGGVGKTRLALEVGANAVADFKNGVWFVDLASLAQSGDVARRVASALHVHEIAS